MIVFTTAGYDGPATFKGDLLRKALKASKAVPVRVLPPKVPKAKPGASAADVQALRAAYAEAAGKYAELARKYGVTAYNTMIFTTPNGEVVTRLVNPSQTQVHRTLLRLDAMIKAFKASRNTSEKADG